MDRTGVLSSGIIRRRVDILPRFCIRNVRRRCCSFMSRICWSLSSIDQCTRLTLSRFFSPSPSDQINENKPFKAKDSTKGPKVSESSPDAGAEDEDAEMEGVKDVAS